MKAQVLLSSGSVALSSAFFLLTCSSLSEALPIQASSISERITSVHSDKASGTPVTSQIKARAPRSKKRSCKAKKGGSASTSNQSTSSTSSNSSSNSSSDSDQEDSTSSANSASPKSSTSDSSSDGQNGSSGVTKGTKQNPKLTKSYLQGGVNGSGWKPPKVTQNDIKMLSDEEANTVSQWSACTKWKDIFEQAAQANGLPLVVLYSFAFEESTCNPKAYSGGDHGTKGLMQLDEDKCKAAPGGNCYDVGYNVNRGAKYFKDTLQDAGGNWDEALGTYNGWYKGMTGSPQGQNLNYISDQINYSYLGKTPPGS